MKNNTQKLTKKELSNILGISYKTALKEYQIILDCLQLKRKYLIQSDIKQFFEAQNE